MPDRTRFMLDERDMPTAWYNVQADLAEQIPPPLDAEGNPMGPEQLAVLFPMECIKQEVSQERYIDVPGAVIDVYKTYRPSPLIRAKALERVLGLPEGVKIFYKYEGVSPAGSHKPNTAIPQAYYNKLEGVKKISTETGAGQWGSALSIAGALFGIEVEVFMVKVSYEQKPYRRILMETYGATVHASPSNLTEAGRHVLAMDPDSTGSLGIAISEAVEVAVKDPDTHYSLGSVLNHVCLHQTVIGLEAIQQMEMAEAEPDVVIGCVGGGSNFAGIAFPYYKRRLDGKSKARLVAVEPKACPTLTAGEYRYDFGDEAKMTPQMMMYTLGHDFVPAGIHAGGLRYHGDSPLVSALVKSGDIEAVAVHQTACFEAAVTFARAEGILPAPESSHAIRVAIDEALAAKEAGEDKTVLFNLSGHGHFDLSAYEAYLAGRLKDYDFAAGTVLHD
ncbi:TrpB-like pyridoxal phosphate-dependent enzyme [Coriobacteriia bacterium Es71-Z0120]|uniref:TrpB-like pyridoxal phosphate-dependent enzyme n=1 Tax=Parvivirga hydrogeniphila TaxID=2939460 RepID=UPI002260EA8C|nr:TrpB-like pyridoxal phosphate-dependent enzyme [Parvivirga hydrogeniphila]MCL4078827.1 TrpB-like pyridoxal phosphate-dependent enzyme [Parvivirga hydrogeniphila]